jgi:hypothetical protein
MQTRRKKLIAWSDEFYHAYISFLAEQLRHQIGIKGMGRVYREWDMMYEVVSCQQSEASSQVRAAQ